MFISDWFFFKVFRSNSIHGPCSAWECDFRGARRSKNNAFWIRSISKGGRRNVVQISKNPQRIGRSRDRNHRTLQTSSNTHDGESNLYKTSNRNSYKTSIYRRGVYCTNFVAINICAMITERRRFYSRNRRVYEWKKRTVYKKEGFLFFLCRVSGMPVHDCPSKIKEIPQNYLKTCYVLFFFSITHCRTRLILRHNLLPTCRHRN